MGYNNINLEIEYQDLLDDLIAGVPQLSADWTDRNPSDFGVMILELYAYLADAYLYKINNVDPLVVRQFLENYLVSETNTINNLDVSYIYDAFDFIYAAFKSELLKEKNLKINSQIIRAYFDNPYRLVTVQDVEHACQIIVANMPVDESGSTEKRKFILKGLNVEHDASKYSFDITLDIDINKPGKSSDTDDLLIKGAVSKLQVALNSRKLLGSRIGVVQAQQAEVQRVYILLKYNADSSEWNRNPARIIVEAVSDYFKNGTRKDELSLERTISLFDLYNKIESLSVVEYVEKIQIQLVDPKAGSEPIILAEAADQNKYRVLYKFSGDISLSNFNDSIKLAKTVTVVPII